MTIQFFLLFFYLFNPTFTTQPLPNSLFSIHELTVGNGMILSFYENEQVSPNECDILTSEYYFSFSSKQCVILPYINYKATMEPMNGKLTMMFTEYIDDNCQMIYDQQLNYSEPFWQKCNPRFTDNYNYQFENSNIEKFFFKEKDEIWEVPDEGEIEIWYDSSDEKCESIIGFKYVPYNDESRYNKSFCEKEFEKINDVEVSPNCYHTEKYNFQKFCSLTPYYEWNEFYRTIWIVGIVGISAIVAVFLAVFVMFCWWMLLGRLFKHKKNMLLEHENYNYIIIRGKDTFKAFNKWIVLNPVSLFCLWLFFDAILLMLDIVFLVYLFKDVKFDDFLAGTINNWSVMLNYLWAILTFIFVPILIPSLLIKVLVYIYLFNKRRKGVKKQLDKCQNIESIKKYIEKVKKCKVYVKMGGNINKKYGKFRITDSSYVYPMLEEVGNFVKVKTVCKPENFIFERRVKRFMEAEYEQYHEKFGFLYLDEFQCSCHIEDDVLKDEILLSQNDRYPKFFTSKVLSFLTTMCLFPLDKIVDGYFDEVEFHIVKKLDFDKLDARHAQFQRLENIKKLKELSKKINVSDSNQTQNTTTAPKKNESIEKSVSNLEKSGGKIQIPKLRIGYIGTSTPTGKGSSLFGGRRTSFYNPNLDRDALIIEIGYPAEDEKKKEEERMKRMREKLKEVKKKREEENKERKKKEEEIEIEMNDIEVNEEEKSDEEEDNLENLLKRENK